MLSVGVLDSETCLSTLHISVAATFDLGLAREIMLLSSESAIFESRDVS